MRPAGPAAGAGAPGPAGSGGPTFRRSGPRPARARRGAVLIAIFLALVLIYSVLAAAIGGPSDSDEYLDTAAPTEVGAMAIAELLRHRQIDVRAGTDARTALLRDDSADRTMVVIRPGRLDRFDLRALADLATDGGDVVLVEPEQPVLASLGLPVTETGYSSGTGAELSPDCALPDPETAGTVTHLAGVLYAPDSSPPSDLDPLPISSATYCYPTAGLLPGEADGHSLVVIPLGNRGGRLVLLGDGGFLINANLAEAGNAALAIGLLDNHATVDWVIQERASEDAVDGSGPVELLGPAFWATLAQVGIAVVLLALWRGRRLGPPVPEPLPVVVRAAETTEGRGRLYAAARARGLAAEALRAGLRARLADRLGIPVHGPARSRAGGPGADAIGTVRPGAVAREIGGPDPQTLVLSVSEQTGRPAQEILPLLYGAGGPAHPTPSFGAPAVTSAEPELDDAALIRLAEQLDELDRQVGGK
ncbi:MAG: DUF4350 domain-containing protein [Frankia sp.]|nr:DUF4350 domain-containing protein [Frankia sp.]